MVQKYKESILRTVIKTLLLRILVFLILTLIVIFILGGTMEDGFAIGVLDIIIELITHYVYDRIWQKIGWGVIIKDLDDPARTYANISLPEKK